MVLELGKKLEQRGANARLFFPRKLAPKTGGGARAVLRLLQSLDCEQAQARVRAAQNVLKCQQRGSGAFPSIRFGGRGREGWMVCAPLPFPFRGAMRERNEQTHRRGFGRKRSWRNGIRGHARQPVQEL